MQGPRFEVAPSEKNMDWGYKAVLTAFAVAVVLMTAQLFGRRLAGMLAGMPVISAPALLWLAHDQGVDFAALSANGSIAACAAAALYAVVYDRLSHRFGPLLSVSASLALGGIAALLLSLLGAGTSVALALAVAACALALRALPADRPPPPPRSMWRQLWLIAGVAGLVSAAVSLVSTAVGPFWSGLLASLPVISTCALFHQHSTAGGASLRPFLSGYVSGLVTKALFAASFAALVLQAPAETAFLLAVLLGLFGTFALSLSMRAAREFAADLQRR